MPKSKVKIVKKIIAKGYPTASRTYREAHAEADNAERKKHPKQYDDMKKIDSRLAKNTLSGTHDRKGDIRISKKVPKRDRPTVILHETVERKAQSRLAKKNKK